MPRKNKKPAEEGGGGGAPGWMVTFGDLMSLLLTFFVLLLSFSSIQDVEFQKALGSLRGALGVLPKQQSVIFHSKVYFPNVGQAEKRKLDQISKEVKEKVEELGLTDGKIDVIMTEKGILIRINSPLLFNSGRAQIRPAILPLLKKVGEYASLTKHMVSIEGHTDNVPIRSNEFPSNWELSTARAISVLKFFLNSGQIAPERLEASGYGEYQPLFSNNTPEERAKNRRVEIFIHSGKEDLNSYHAIDLLNDLEE